jgi:hypothetical protein
MASDPFVSESDSSAMIYLVKKAARKGAPGQGLSASFEMSGYEFAAQTMPTMMKTLKDAGGEERVLELFCAQIDLPTKRLRDDAFD